MNKDKVNRIARGIVHGFVDGLPVISQVANTIRQADLETRPAGAASEHQGARIVAGVLTLLAVGAAWLANVDCDTLARIAAEVCRQQRP